MVELHIRSWIVKRLPMGYLNLNNNFMDQCARPFKSTMQPIKLKCTMSEGVFGKSSLLALYQSLTKTPKIYVHQQFTVRQTKNETSYLLAKVNTILSLKEARATNIVIENKLQEFLFYFKNAKKEDKEDFVLELAEKYSVNHDLIVKTSKLLSELETSSGLFLKTEDKLREQLIPQYVWLFRYLSRLEHGVKFLVDLRRDILVLLSNLDAKSSHQLTVKQLNSNLKELLNLWFSVGFLQIERVKWSSSCTLLEKVADYEAVHPVRSWRDLKQRMGAYRRCFVYTHHSMPGQPLVILHVALTKDIEHSLNNIVHLYTGKDAESSPNNVEEDPSNIKAFIFYSISATQQGLQGIDLGNYLIKQAAKELHAENPQANKFSTLSPIPTFRQWLLEKVKGAEKGEHLLPLKEWEELLEIINPNDKTDAWAKIKSMLLDNSWIRDESLVSALKGPLMAACCRYLYLEKRRDFAFDSVANFHLRNGAVMWRLNWLADTSLRGLTNSCGLMVNYRYYLDAADANSLKYIQDRTFIASEQIIKLATQHQHCK